MLTEKGKIVIIEDDRFLSSLIKARLDKEGYSTSLAFDGEEGLALLKRELPRVLILDLVLPRITGFELLETMSRDPQLKEIKAVVLSNLAQDFDIEKAKRLGAQEYFVKVRVSLDDLLKKIKDMMNQ